MASYTDDQTFDYHRGLPYMTGPDGGQHEQQSGVQFLNEYSDSVSTFALRDVPLSPTSKFTSEDSVEQYRPSTISPRELIPLTSFELSNPGDIYTPTEGHWTDAAASHAQMAVVDCESCYAMGGMPEGDCISSDAACEAMDVESSVRAVKFETTSNPSPSPSPIGPVTSIADVQVAFTSIVKDLEADPEFGPFVPQKMYRPTTKTDKRRYVEDVALQLDPYYFFTSSARGILLETTKFEKGKKSVICGAADQVLRQCGPSISVRVEWPGCESFSAQMSTLNYKSVREPITRAKLAYELYKVIKKLFALDPQKNGGASVDADADGAWDLRRFCPEDLVLVSLHQISQGSWQPQLRLRKPLDAYPNVCYVENT